MKILIIYNLPSENESADDIDVLIQVEAVRSSLQEMGYNVKTFGLDLNLKKFLNRLLEEKPDLVFNLVEALEKVEMYLHFAPTILEKLNIPYTGGSSETLFTTTNKVLTKILLNQYDIPTPKWILGKDISKNVDFPSPYIIKPVSTDASVGLEDSSVIYDPEILKKEFIKRNKKYGSCFIEEYIDGREFNVSVIEFENAPLILPIAEIKFKNYPKEKARIVNYNAKWNEETFEFKNTIRCFDFSDEDLPLLLDLKRITLQCWQKFRISGYARIDFRVDENGIYVLELNVNPCISPDSGFYASFERYGLDYKKMVEMMVVGKINKSFVKEI